MASPTPPPIPEPGPISVPGPGPAPKNSRLALTLNFILPGAGLFYLGRRVAGLCVAAVFLLCLMAVVGLFLVDYARYFALATNGHILEGDQLERLGKVFHTHWLIGLAIAGVLIHVASMWVVWQTPKQTN